MKQQLSEYQAVRNIVAASIRRAIRDYQTLEERGLIRDGKVARKLRRTVGKKTEHALYYYNCEARIQELIEYFTDGHLRDHIEQAGVRACPDKILKLLGLRDGA